MCNYEIDDVATRNNTDEQNIVHFQSKSLTMTSAAATAAPTTPFSNVKYLSNKSRNNVIVGSPKPFDVTSIVIVNADTSSNSNLLNIF
jgi:hypothetical protein